MLKKESLFLACSLLIQIGFSQTILEADGSGNTYELISSILAPGYNPIEVPDCSHASFGRHIDEVFDVELNAYAFRFYIHSSPDDDRCINFDRQRNEIKSYDQSPDSLLAILNEKVQYKWKFKLDSTFQASSSFTHLHQIKAVGGSEESMPLITLTARKASPDRLELRYAESLSQVTIHQVGLDAFRGNWVEVTETMTCGEIESGEYEILITNLSNGDTLLHYMNDSIRMWKTNASFLRPKWGIYRSLNNSINLKDEAVLFADFRIEELLSPTTYLPGSAGENAGPPVYPNPSSDFLMFSDWAMAEYDACYLYKENGQLVLTQDMKSDKVAVSHLASGLYFIDLRKKGVQVQFFKILIE